MVRLIDARRGPSASERGVRGSTTKTQHAHMPKETSVATRPSAAPPHSQTAPLLKTARLVSSTAPYPRYQTLVTNSVRGLLLSAF